VIILYTPTQASPFAFQIRQIDQGTKKLNYFKNMQACKVLGKDEVMFYSSSLTIGNSYQVINFSQCYLRIASSNVQLGINSNFALVSTLTFVEGTKTKDVVQTLNFMMKVDPNILLYSLTKSYILDDGAEKLILNDYFKFLGNSLNLRLDNKSYSDDVKLNQYFSTPLEKKVSTQGLHIVNTNRYNRDWATFVLFTQTNTSKTYSFNVKIQGRSTFSSLAINGFVPKSAYMT
jgi:hypothetical protein